MTCSIASSAESTVFTARISAWYSVSQSSSVASASESARSPASARVRPSTRSSTPRSRSSCSARGRNAAAASACTSSVSAALQTDGPLHLRVEGYRDRVVEVGVASTKTWQLPAAA